MITRNHCDVSQSGYDEWDERNFGCRMRVTLWWRVSMLPVLLLLCSYGWLGVTSHITPLESWVIRSEEVRRKISRSNRPHQGLCNLLPEPDRHPTWHRPTTECIQPTKTSHSSDVSSSWAKAFHNLHFPSEAQKIIVPLSDLVGSCVQHIGILLSNSCR